MQPWKYILKKNSDNYYYFIRLTYNSGQAANAHVSWPLSLFTKQNELVPASYIAGWGERMCALMPRSLTQESISWQ